MAMWIRGSMVVVAVLCVCGATGAAPIKVLTLDSSRNFGGRSEDFAGGSLYSGFRGSLLNTANFGASGTIAQEVQLLGAVASLDSTNLSGADVVIWSQRSGPSTAERTALNGFLESGGGLMIVSDAIHSFPGILGSTVVLGDFVGGHGNGSVTADDNAISNGVFGDVRGDSISLGSAFNLTSIGAPSFDALSGATNLGSSIEVSAFGDHVDGGTTYPGRIAVFGDDDIFITQSGVSYQVGGVSEKIALNSFAYVAANAIAVPEPGTFGLGVIVVGLIAARRHRLHKRAAV